MNPLALGLAGVPVVASVGTLLMSAAKDSTVAKWTTLTLLTVGSVLLLLGVAWLTEAYVGIRRQPKRHVAPGADWLFEEIQRPGPKWKYYSSVTQAAIKALSATDLEMKRAVRLRRRAVEFYALTVVLYVLAAFVVTLTIAPK